jgi:hypothetical protein
MSSSDRKRILLAQVESMSPTSERGLHVEGRDTELTGDLGRGRRQPFLDDRAIHDEP